MNTNANATLCDEQTEREGRLHFICPWSVYFVLCYFAVGQREGWSTGKHLSCVWWRGWERKGNKNRFLKTVSYKGRIKDRYCERFECNTRISKFTLLIKQLVVYKSYQIMLKLIHEKQKSTCYLKKLNKPACITKKSMSFSTLYTNSMKPNRLESLIRRKIRLS